MSSPTTSYTDGGLSPSTTYSYKVSAYDAASNNSAQSSQATATTRETPPPGRPSTKVHGHYYPWYANPTFDGQWRHWNDCGTGYTSHNPAVDDLCSPYYPQLGAYSSKDPAAIRQQLAALDPPARPTGAGDETSRLDLRPIVFHLPAADARLLENTLRKFGDGTRRRGELLMAALRAKQPAAPRQ